MSRIFWALAASLAISIPSVVEANAYREQGKEVEVADSAFILVPPRDWNRLDWKPGKFTEVWTLDGELLNDVTFYGGVPAGQPLVKERSKKHEPLPKFEKATLIAEIPELLERTYRAYKKIGSFSLTSSQPEQFLGGQGIRFTYDYVDADQLPRKGEARAVLLSGKLYMATFDAPRLSYFDKAIGDARALIDSARRPAK